MFTNFFTGQAKPVEQQAQDILDIVFRGILTEPGTRRPTRGRQGRSLSLLHAVGSNRRLGFDMRTEFSGGSDTHGSPLVWRSLAHRRRRRWPAAARRARRPVPPAAAGAAGRLRPAGHAGRDRLRGLPRPDRRASISVEVRARVSGYLDRVYFQDGTKVNKGDMLFQIDPRPFKADARPGQRPRWSRPRPTPSGSNNEYAAPRSSTTGACRSAARSTTATRSTTPRRRRP